MEELNTSELGTKDYWNNVYNEELTDFQNHGDPGCEWFGKSATNRVVKWVDSSKQISKNSTILDIGCGNGLMLLELARRGYNNVTGVDYCPDALELAKSVFKAEKVDANASWLPLDITCETIATNIDTNVLRPWKRAEKMDRNHAQKTFDVCLDKGTYDAVSLNPDNAFEKRGLYIECLKRLLSPAGLFLIVSCNWTGQELRTHFSNFRFVEELKAPSFTFGGKSGQTVSTCVFEYSSTGTEENLCSDVAAT